MFIYLLYFISIVVCCKCDFVVSEPDESDLEKPCAYDDQPCIKAEFIKRGWCEKAYEYPFKNEPVLHVTTLNYTSPSFNIVINHHDAYIKGPQHGKIVALYTNKKTQVTVLSVEFENVEIEGSITIHYYRNLKEDIVISTTLSETYPVITTTTGIPPGENVFSEIRTRAHIPEIGKFEFGVKDVNKIKDEEIRDLIKNIYANKRLLVSDLFEDKAYEDRAHMFASAYVENIICEMQNDKSKTGDV